MNITSFQSDCPDPWAGPCPWPCWTPWGLHGPTCSLSRSLWMAHPFPPVCQPHHTAWSRRQTFWECLDPTVHVADKDVKQRRSQHQPLRDTTCHCSPHGHWAVDHNSLSATIQPIPYPLSGLSSNSHFSNLETSMSCGTVSNAQVQVDDVSCSTLIREWCNPIVEFM